ncbi:hypothetical protein H4217_005529 [Coemansia sp. RSA 1939]|nr:hypothetical protein H4217_005529 [Coemansia sp. RSA 1939]KAJ2615774.1 hypothetical protein EV177_001420 [Coemansia sp. RSA 1804]
MSQQGINSNNPGGDGDMENRAEERLSERRETSTSAGQQRTDEAGPRALHPGSRLLNQDTENDEYTQHAPRPGQCAGIGGDDLRPPLPEFNDPMRVTSSGGGMFVGTDHPLFGPRAIGGSGGGGSSGSNIGPGDADPFAGPQRLPPGAVPQGARFDPIVPFGEAPGGMPGRGRGGRGRGGGGAHFSGEPDPDALPPPGGRGFGFGGSSGFGNGGPDTFL